MRRNTQSLLRRLREVGMPGWFLLVKTFCLLLAARLALRWMPVKKVIAWKQSLALAGGSVEPDRWRRVRWAVLTVARYSPIEFVCFPQCLAAAKLLADASIPTRLHYGVARDGSKLKTHTWLEAQGEIVIGGEVADQFSTLDVY